MNFDSEPLGFSIRNDNCAHCDLCNTLAVDWNKNCIRSVTCANCNTKLVLLFILPRYALFYQRDLGQSFWGLVYVH